MEAKGGKIDTSWTDPDLDWTVSPRVRAAALEFGSDSDQHRAVAIVAEYPPNAKVPAHHHSSNYISIMVEGSMRVGKKWHERGSIRIVKERSRYGPLLAGPNGCTVVDVFADRTGFMPTGISEKDIQEYGLKGELEKTRGELGLDG